MQNLSEKRQFGKTNIQVSALGFGAGMLGSSQLSNQDAEQLLHFLLDHGITLIDTARGYDLSEERIGEFISDRRHEFVLSTKVGYGVVGEKDWTGSAISKGIDDALKRLRTDYLDIVLLHSCPKSILERGDCINALSQAVSQGKVRSMGYSGDNEDAAYAVSCGSFSSLMMSVNICDQRAIEFPLPEAKALGMGVLAKRPMANAPWNYMERPIGQYVLPYWDRWQAMALNVGIPFDELSLRFAAFTSGIDCCVVGTTKIETLKKNINIIAKGKLTEDVVQLIRDAFFQHDVNWIGQT